MKKDYQQLNCTIPQTDYNLFKSVAFLKGFKVNEAMLAAMHLWLSQEKSKLITNKNNEPATAE